jgi:hypothetical protein
MRHICIKILLLSYFFCFLSITAEAQEKIASGLKAEEILARVDNILKYPQGKLTGKMIHVFPDGKSRVITIWGAVSGEDLLFKFSSSDRDEELKILYNLKNKDTWVYDVHANMLFNKREIGKFDSIMLTNFSFTDLSHASLQGNYTAKITGETLIKGNDCYRLMLEPVLKNNKYGMLEIFVSKKDFIPLKIDFHDNDKIIFKTMSIVKTGFKNGRTIPVRYDMLDIKERTVTLLEFFESDESVKFEKKIFRYENLREN